MSDPKCIICEGATEEHGGFCQACRNAYDTFNDREPTTIELIDWVATRARNSVKKKIKGK